MKVDSLVYDLSSTNLGKTTKQTNSYSLFQENLDESLKDLKSSSDKKTNSKFSIINDTITKLQVTDIGVSFGFVEDDPITKDYFSTLLENSEGILSGEMEFRQALNELKNDMQELVTFVYEQYDKGINFALEFGSVSISVFADIASCLDILDDISNLVGKKNLSQDEQNRLAKQIEGLFSLYTYSAMSMAKSFDYVRSRVDGLDEDKILRNLLIVKGFFQNNSKENLVLADGTTVGVKSVIEGNEIKDYLSINGYSVLLEMKDSFNLDEHSKKLENEKFEVLFGISADSLAFNHNFAFIKEQLEKNSNIKDIKDSAFLSSLLKLDGFDVR